MIAWWIGVIAFLVIGVPLLVLLLHRMLREAVAMRRTADDMAGQGEVLASHLEGVDDTQSTSALLDEVTVGITRYGLALEELRRG